MLYIATGKEVHGIYEDNYLKRNRSSPLSSSTTLLEYPKRTLHHTGDTGLKEIASGKLGKSFR
ncbi:MAG: hypothetical protein AAGF04_05750 [Chlamydiota bacterium]